MSPAPKAAPAREPESFQARLVKAKAAVDGVKKDGRNSQQNYDFASVEGILRAIRGPLHENGINLSTSTTKLERETITSGRGGTGERLTVHLQYSLRDTLSQESTAHSWIGVGEDFGDKAISKAYTSALKTFILSEWQLPKGEDPEADKHVPTVSLPWYCAPAETTQIAELGATLTPLIGRDAAAALVKQIRQDNQSEVCAGQVRALLILAMAVPAPVAEPAPSADAAARMVADKFDAIPAPDVDADKFLAEQAALDQAAAAAKGA